MRRIETPNPLLVNMVRLEMAGAIERWRFEHDAVHALLAIPSCACGCKRYHCWFVSRDGRTRCWECDAEYVAEKGKLVLAGLVAE